MKSCPKTYYLKDKNNNKTKATDLPTHAKQFGF
jgi:hypothetical protein